MLLRLHFHTTCAIHDEVIGLRSRDFAEHGQNSNDEGARPVGTDRPGEVEGTGQLVVNTPSRDDRIITARNHAMRRGQPARTWSPGDVADFLRRLTRCEPRSIVESAACEKHTGGIALTLRSTRSAFALASLQIMEHNH